MFILDLWIFSAGTGFLLGAALSVLSLLELLYLEMKGGKQWVKIPVPVTGKGSSDPEREKVPPGSR